MQVQEIRSGSNSSKVCSAFVESVMPRISSATSRGASSSLTLTRLTSRTEEAFLEDVADEIRGITDSTKAEQTFESLSLT